MFETLEKGALTLTIEPSRGSRYRATVTRAKALKPQIMAQDHRILLATIEADTAEEAVRLAIEQSQKRLEEMTDEQ